MDNLKIVGNLEDFNTTIIGTFKSGKSLLGKKLSADGYYLSMETLMDINMDIKVIKSRLKLNNYLEATQLQNKIIANIINLVDQGNKMLVIDDLLTFIDRHVKGSLIIFLKENKIRFINITADIEDTLYTQYLIVMFNGKIALEGKTLEVLKEERLLKRMGFNLPFIVDLSIQLKYYGLVDDIYLNPEELVSVLWK